jgi:hypothetical protein
MRTVKNEAPHLENSKFKKNGKYGIKNSDEDRLLGCIMMESQTGEFVTFEDVLKVLRQK